MIIEITHTDILNIYLNGYNWVAHVRVSIENKWKSSTIYFYDFSSINFIFIYWFWNHQFNKNNVRHLTTRQEKILDILKKNKNVKVDNLSIDFKVSEQSIRKDLNEICGRSLALCYAHLNFILKDYRFNNNYWKF